MEFIIVGLVIALFAVIPIAFMVVMGQKRAKKEARRILESGDTNMKKINRTIRTLSSARDNEAADLVRRLNDLKFKNTEQKK